VDYSRIEDESITSEVIKCLTQIIENGFEQTPWLVDGFFPEEMDASLFLTPLNFSCRSKKEFFSAKKELLGFLKFSSFSKVTNQNWKGRSIYEWDDRLENRINTIKTLHEKLVRRTIANIKKKNTKRKKSRKQVTLKQLSAARDNAGISAYNRIVESYELTRQIEMAALELIANGTPRHNVAAQLNRKFQISERQIRRHLNRFGFRSIRVQDVHRDRDGNILRLTVVDKYKQ